MRLIPGKTKVDIELFKGVTLPDILVGAVGASMVVLALLSTLPGKLYIALAVGLLTVGLVVRTDTVANYTYLLHIVRHFGYTRKFVSDKKTVGRQAENAENSENIENAADAENKSESVKSEKSEKKNDSSKSAPASRITAFTGIKDGFIEYDGKYYGAVLEIPPVEFRFFGQLRRNNAIEGGLGRVLRSVNADYCANIVKIERPIIYDEYLQLEYDRLDNLKASYENGMLTEDEYKSRIEILYDRINDVQKLCSDNKVIEPFYYLVFFESDKNQLRNMIDTAVNTLFAAEMSPKRLGDKELAVFLRYTNELDFDEHEIDDVDPADYVSWATPQSIDIKARTIEVNHIITHNMRVVTYPTVVGDAWLATVMSMPGTKVVVKCRPMERGKALRGIDRSLQELRGQYAATGVDSKRIELQSHIDTLGELLSTLQQDNESLFDVNIYVSVYDIAATRANKSAEQPPKSDRSSYANMKKTVRRCYQENGFRLNNMEFDQMQAYIGSQISGYDPMLRQSRGIPSNSLAACFPWVFAHVSDVGGIKFGSSQGVPVFIDFFKRDSERVNSNMVIVGKSGSGKSFATKSLLTNLAAEDCKIFILDPENEYTELAENLHGKFINVGNAQYGRLNPFQIITALDDDETGGSTVSGSYATHLQFLEEFFRQILPDCDKDALEYLNSLIDRMYTNRGITGETDLSRLRPEDYPVFDDLYDTVLSEFQRTDNEYIRTILRTLMNYVAKFSTGGRNANIWNGPSTITTDENFTVFNFQSLISNRNSTIANAQMLLVLKYIDNEIIKNRDYNKKYGLERKIVVVIDEAHVFIDTKFPVALDFMFQLAKRIRKYNGMQIVITQNIKDFVGSEEISRKSTAIINACQYSFIFALAPNDIQDLCKLYEKAGGINEVEQEQITTAPRGQAFTVMSPMSRTTFRVEVPTDVAAMFREKNFRSRYFSGEDGAATWESIVGDSREKNLENRKQSDGGDERDEVKFTQSGSSVSFVEISEEKYNEEEQNKKTDSDVCFFEETEEIPTVETTKAEEKSPSAARDEIRPTGRQADNSANEALTELLSKFSYDALVREIRRNVEDAVDERIRDMKAVEVPIAPEKSASGVENTDEISADDSRKDGEEITGDDKTENAPTDNGAESPDGITSDEKEEDVGDDDSGENAETTDSDDGMSIMSFLQSAAGEIDLPTPIETMETFDEKVVDVTLDDLVRYNRRKRSHGNKGY